MVPDASQRQRYMTADVQLAVQRALQTRQALSDQPNYASTPEGEAYFSPETCARLICALLKQLAEKLDVVRKCAGEALEQLISSNSPRIPYMPSRPALVEALQLSNRPAVVGSGASDMTWASSNWALAHVTFPMVVKLILLDEYHEAVVAGLVVSVGGLTEAVVKSASSSLLQLTKSLDKAKAKRDISHLGHTLVALFAAHRKDDRVIVPLLKTSEVLLESGAFNVLREMPAADGDSDVSASSSGWGLELLAAVKLELYGCRDVKKLFGAIDVYLGLLTFGERVRTDVLKQCLMLLAHRYPRVRKFAAERLYTKILVSDGVLPTQELCDRVSEMLSAVAWDGELEEIKPSQLELAALLEIELPAPKKAGERKQSTKSKADELESYQFLVRDAGY
jgi:hypothetical protein